mgnify:CR=1 FL=1
MSEPIVLGIESTCDETAAAVVQGRTLISNVVASSMDEHARYGGVIPEIASRAHAEAFVPCVSKALADANMTLSDVDAIAVSAGPGLAGCLAVGVSGAAYVWHVNMLSDLGDSACRIRAGRWHIARLGAADAPIRPHRPCRPDGRARRPLWRQPRLWFFRQPL